MLSKDELLRDRYKCIAIDTSESFKVGEILTHPPEWGARFWVTPSDRIIIHPEKYPHLFQPLPWWSDRKPEDLPEYVKNDRGLCFRVDSWRIEDDAFFFKDGPASLRNKLPATRAEYEAYQQSKNK